MAENPLVTLARVLGGLVLTQGNLGHQVLGQLMIMNTNEVAMAAASVVLAGTSGQRSVVGQMALRTVAPALAVRALLNKQEERLKRSAIRLSERERALRGDRTALRRRIRRLKEERAQLEALRAALTVGSPPSSPPGSPPSSPPPSPPASPPFSPAVTSPPDTSPPTGSQPAGSGSASSPPDGSSAVGSPPDGSSVASASTAALTGGPAAAPAPTRSRKPGLPSAIGTTRTTPRTTPARKPGAKKR